MHISRIRLQNWKNFGMRPTETSNLGGVNYIIGHNASGKSNLLDAIRFLRDIAKPTGGGLQKAIKSRGGMKKIRCVHATNKTNVIVEVDIADADDQKLWTYLIDFNLPPRGDRKTQAPIIKREKLVRHDGEAPETVLERPNDNDKEDDYLLHETHLEQGGHNREFRDLVSFLAGVTYVHLVPQLVKFGDRIGDHVLEEDPFGQAFMQRIAKANKTQQTSRLKRIEKALNKIVPGLEELKFVKDEITGMPHLQIRYKHYRKHGHFQHEDQFSDGTLRLIALLWLLQESGDSPLLLEEPELSLNEEIVRRIPEMIQAMRNVKSPRQVFITTHSEALLSNEGIGPRGIVMVKPSDGGSTLHTSTQSQKQAMADGLSPAEAVLPAVSRIEQGLLL